MTPDFLYIGPPKSASTWLYEVMRGHPAISVPVIKDIYYFDRYFDRGAPWYEAHFANAPAGTLATGEFSHDYLYCDIAAARIAEALPDVRLMTILRQPMERALSEFRFLQRSGLVGANFETAVAGHRYDIVTKGLYGSALRPYWARFSSNRIATFVYDDLLTDAKGFANTVFAFLGVPVLTALPIAGRVNAQSAARAPRLARLAKRGARAARDMGLSGLVGRIKRHPLALRLLYKPAPNAPVVIPRRLYDELAEVFTADLHDLETLTGRRFPTLAMTHFDTNRVTLI